jgi:flagellin-like protein
MRSRRGISNVVATIILIAVAIALAVAVAVWVFGLAGGASKASNLQVILVTLSGVSGGKATLGINISNPSSSSIGIQAITFGNSTCQFTPVISVPSGANGGITLTFQNNKVTGNTTLILSGGLAGQTVSAVCSGGQVVLLGVQYSGTIVTNTGQQYPYTVTASS